MKACTHAWLYSYLNETFSPLHYALHPPGYIVVPKLHHMLNMVGVVWYHLITFSAEKNGHHLFSVKVKTSLGVIVCKAGCGFTQTPPTYENPMQLLQGSSC